MTVKMLRMKPPVKKRGRPKRRLTGAMKDMQVVGVTRRCRGRGEMEADDPLL